MTDSVFRVLFAYFHESIASKIVYKPWRSWNTVDLTQIQIKNEFITVPYVVGFLSFTSGAYEFSVEFCVVKFSSFG